MSVLRLILAAVSASIPAIVAMPARIAAIVEIAGAAIARRRRRALSAWPVGNTKPAARTRRFQGTRSRETATGELVGKSGR